jgi:hypothetical protein
MQSVRNSIYTHGSSWRFSGKLSCETALFIVHYDLVVSREGIDGLARTIGAVGCLPPPVVRWGEKSVLLRV